jgi:hypothetical protein
MKRFCVIDGQGGGIGAALKFQSQLPMNFAAIFA